MKINSLISGFDQISDPPQLFFNGKSRYTSLVGGAGTLILYIMSLAGFGYFSLDLIYHADPFLFMSTSYSNQSRYIVNTSETIVAFMIADKKVLPMDTEGMLEIRGEKVSYYADYDEINKNYGETKIKIEKLNFTKCTELEFNSTKIFSMLYQSMADFHRYSCLSPNQVIQIKNPFGSQYYSYLNVFIARCFNKSSCKSQEEIDKNFKYFTISSMFTDYYTNGNDYLEPVIPYRQVITDHISTYSYKRKYVELQYINFSSDDGWILPNKQNLINPAMKRTREVTQFNEVFLDNHGSVLYQWTLGFSTDGLHLNYFRLYTKLQNIFANVGGLIKALKLAIYFVLYIFLEIFKTTCIFDNFVIVSKNEEYQINLKKDNKKIQILMNKNRSVSENNFVLYRGSTKPNDNNVKRFGYPVYFNASNLRLFAKKVFFCNKKHNHNYEIYLKSAQILREKYFDIIHLIELQNQIYFIKNFLFKDKQEILIAFERLSQIVHFDEDYPRLSKEEIVSFLNKHLNFLNN